MHSAGYEYHWLDFVDLRVGYGNAVYVVAQSGNSDFPLVKRPRVKPFQPTEVSLQFGIAVREAVT